MIYLLKGSRVQEYRRDNIAILGASEGDRFEVSYSRRWVADGLSPIAGTGAVIVFGDSPFESFVPIRFCVIETVDDTPEKVRLALRLGPFVHAEGHLSLTELWAGRSDDDRPGRKFLFEDENPGLFGPQSDADLVRAWRTAATGLAVNGFFEHLTAMRADRITDGRGAELRPNDPVEVGDTITVSLEACTPWKGREWVEPFLDVEPRGGAALVTHGPLSAVGVGEIQIQVLEPGPQIWWLGFKPEPLDSSRLEISVESVVPRVAAPATNEVSVTAATSTGDGVEVAPRIEVGALLDHLRRDASLDHKSWVRLHESVLLPGQPGDPVLLGNYAEHAYAAGEFVKAAAALTELADPTPSQLSLLLLASLRASADVSYAELLSESDFAADRVFPEVVEAIAGAEPATLHLMMSLLSQDLLSDDKLIALADAVWQRASWVDVVCDFAEKVAYLDPDIGADLLLNKWPRPDHIPDRALELLLDWGARVERLGPYVQDRLDRALDRGDWGVVVSTANAIRDRVTRSEQPELLARAGRHLLDSNDDGRRSTGYALICEAVMRACDHGDVDLALANLPALRSYARQSELIADRDSERAISAHLDQVMEHSEAMVRWAEMVARTEYDALRPAYEGRTLHLVGGSECSWIEEISDGLALGDWRWHETSRSGNKKVEWTSGLSDRDVVVIITDFIGHSISGQVEVICGRRGVQCFYGRMSRIGVLEALRSGVSAS